MNKREQGNGIHPALAKRYEVRTPGNSVPPEQVLAHESVYPGYSAPDEELRQVPLPIIPGYDVRRCIGKGAMGHVFYSLHHASGREAAVKVLSAELVSRPDLVARFEREVAVLRSFRHPNVVAILDSGTYRGMPYYCMEFVRGTTLRRYLQNGALEPQKAVSFVRSVLAGLGAAHDRGIIHRDLKPENILVSTDRVVLADFGLAGMLNDGSDPHPNLTHSRVTMGTVNYMAPEQHVDAKRVDQRTDLYACGVILYECLTGELPIGRYDLPSEKGRQLPLGVDALITKALAQKPEDRFLKAEDFDRALGQFEKELATYKVVKAVSHSEPVLASPPQNSFPNQSSRSGSFLTRWATIPPIAKKPRMLWALGALIVGLISGIWMAKRTPLEVMVSSKGATPIFSKSHFAGPAPYMSLEAGDIQRAQLSSMGPSKKWRSYSPVWGFSTPHFSYDAGQGNGGHFRRDFAIASSPMIFSKSLIEFTAQIKLHPVMLSLDPKKAQHLAREALGGMPEMGGGGVFVTTNEEKRAVGMVMFVDGSCGLVELSRNGSLLELKQFLRGLCNNPKKQHGHLGVRCDTKAGECSGYLGDKLIVSGYVHGMERQQWQPGLGCRNVTCVFGGPKPIT